MDPEAMTTDAVVADLDDALNALASPVRRSILNQLRVAKPLSELRVEPTRGSSKLMSKQAVQTHLKTLVDASLVRTVEPPKGHSARVFYVMDISAMYGAASSLMELCSTFGGETAADTLTRTVAQRRTRDKRVGPHLLLVQGAYPGKRYLLRDKTAVDGVWRIGRRRDAPVALEYDPYVSRDNSIVLKAGRWFEIRGEPGAANGTWVNWKQLAPGEHARLAPGDVISVGKSTLIFHT